METKDMGAGIAGVGIGAGQTYVLRKYVDATPLVASFGNWGYPSALVGVVGGIIGAGLGVPGLMGKGPLARNKTVATALAGYGLTALAGGIYSGMNPVVVAARAPVRVAAARVPTRMAAVGTPVATQPGTGVAHVLPTVMPYAQVPGQAIRVVEQGGGLIIRSLGQ